MHLSDKLKNHIDKSWIDTLLPMLTSDDMKGVFTHLRKLRDEGHRVYPEPKNLLKAFRLTPLDQLRVVILGQDPYPGISASNFHGGILPYATGLAFGIPDEAMGLPASLRNIRDEVVRSDVSTLKELSFDQSLVTWAMQGVLLLNTALTVKAGEPGSHSHLWKPFTTELMTFLGKKEEPIIWLLWGAHAQSYEKYIGPQHTILKTSHPSPLSYKRGFEGCGHFKAVNEILKDNPIEW